MLFRSIERGLVNSKARYDDALETNARIKSKLAALHDAPKAPPRSSAPLQLIITQSAADAGFTLDRNDAQGEGRADISIAAARPTALFPWISSLEAQGLKVESLTAQPAPTQGSISVQMVVTDGLQ